MFPPPGLRRVLPPTESGNPPLRPLETWRPRASRSAERARARARVGLPRGASPRACRSLFFRRWKTEGGRFECQLEPQVVNKQRPSGHLGLYRERSEKGHEPIEKFHESKKTGTLLVLALFIPKPRPPPRPRNGPSVALRSDSASRLLAGTPPPPGPSTSRGPAAAPGTTKPEDGGGRDAPKRQAEDMGKCLWPEKQRPKRPPHGPDAG